MNQRGAAGEASENVTLSDGKTEESCPSPNDDNQDLLEISADDTTTNSSNTTLTKDGVDDADKNGNCPDAEVAFQKTSNISQGCESLQEHPNTESNQGGGGDTAEKPNCGTDDNSVYLKTEAKETKVLKIEQCLNKCFVSCGGDASYESMKSILKKGPDSTPSIKTVAFAENVNYIVDTKLQDMFFTFNWGGVTNHATDELVHGYQLACAKAKTVPIDVILEQLQKIKDNRDHSAILNLTSVKVNGDVINMLETIFQMINFRTIYINIALLDSDITHDIFNMIDYYDPTHELVISGHREDLGMWQSFADATCNNRSLSSVSFREVNIEDQALRIIFDGINSNQNIKIVRFDGCELNRAPAFMLANHLKNNYFLEELHLCFSDLYFKEADILGKFLAVNTTLKILNLSNNKIGDRGFDALARGLLEQSQKGEGVVVLMLPNNRLTEKCAETLKTIISCCRLLHSINMGVNNLTDFVIGEIKSTLAATTTLKTFGLQSILLTCSGLHDLADACQVNKSLRHLNLRGNKAVQSEALNELADVIHRTTLVQIDVDDVNRSCSNPQQYIEVINKIRHMVAVNKIVWEDLEPDQYQIWGREFSLNCEPEFVPQPRVRTRARTTAAAAAAASRSRFKVVTVPESTPTAPLSPTHRFTVVSVSTSNTAVVGAVGSTSKDADKTQELVPERAQTFNVKNVSSQGAGDAVIMKNTDASAEAQIGNVDTQSILSVNTDVGIVTVHSDTPQQQKDVELLESVVDNALGSTNTVAPNRDDCASGEPSQTID